jgi:hypothetical protein
MIDMAKKILDTNTNVWTELKEHQQSMNIVQMQGSTTTQREVESETTTLSPSDSKETEAKDLTDEQKKEISYYSTVLSLTLIVHKNTQQCGI